MGVCFLTAFQAIPGDKYKGGLTKYKIGRKTQKEFNMKEVILVRHGKSSRDYQGVVDMDRPLTERGISDAALVAMYFAKQSRNPQLVCSSPANRALHTAMIFMDKMGIDPSRVNISKELYNFSPEPVVRFIRNLDQSFNSVMIFGHNPTFTSIANIFGNKPIDNLPTAGAVILKFEVSDWHQINKGLTEIIVFPKLFY